MSPQPAPEDLSTVLARASAKSSDNPADKGLIGARIGPYQIVAELGHGGMGVVYRAVRVDGEFEATVAIKIIRHGFRSELLLERFRAERQIQARLHHANIVRMLDGGTTEDGMTYFVMEYIEGLRLTEYCDRQQLPITERLKLFREICDAVSYAHQNLIVHRDLKPDNILVTSDGKPKLLDFGIAKILEVSEDGSEATMTMVRMGTPAYASPEQIRGEAVGVGTDIYSLGVVLYELLTGKRPYRLDSLGWDESARVICERDATRPSSMVASKAIGIDEAERIMRARKTTTDALRRRLSGDLDNIVSAALRKDPLRRYRSVDQLSEEIQNHLEHRPIKGRGDSIVYKLRKLIGRHKLGTGVAAVLTVLLLSASGFAAWQAHRLASRLDEDRKLATSFLVDVHEAIAKLPGSTPVREALLMKSMKYLDGLSAQTGKDREMRRTFALAYERFADLQVGVEGAGFGQSNRALKTYATARSIREALAQEAPDDHAAQYELAQNYLMGSYISGRASTLQQRMTLDEKALAIGERLHRADAGNRSYNALLARAYTSVAYGQGMSAHWAAAITDYHKALAIREVLAQQNPHDAGAQREIANLHYRVGVTETQSGRPAEGRADLTEALKIQNRLLEADEENGRLRSEIAGTHHFLGMAMSATGELPQALRHFHDAIAIREQALAADQRDARTRSLLAGNYAEQAITLLKCGQKKQSFESIRHALALQAELLAFDSSGVPTRLSMADYHARLGMIDAAIGNTMGAAQSWREARNMYDKLDREGHLKPSDLQEEARKARLECAKYGI